jgi:hypothetical protein
LSALQRELRQLVEAKTEEKHFREQLLALSVEEKGDKKGESGVGVRVVGYIYMYMYIYIYWLVGALYKANGVGAKP